MKTCAPCTDYMDIVIVINSPIPQFLNEECTEMPSELIEIYTVYCFLFVVKKFHGCKSFPSFPEKYSWLCQSAFAGPEVAYYNWPSYKACSTCIGPTSFLNVSAKVSPKNFCGHGVIHENRETFSLRTKSNIR